MEGLGRNAGPKWGEQVGGGERAGRRCRGVQPRVPR